MKIHPAQPNSLEWMAARAGVVTASEFDNIVTPLFAIRTGQMPFTYLAQKVAEKWIGGPLPGFSSIDMEIGSVLEEKAIPLFQMETGYKVERVGLITSDDGKVGCTPDGLLADPVAGLECKCPRDETHVKYLLNGALPLEYAAQVHGAMYVTGRQLWYFMSYARGFPPFILKVKRDEKIIAVIDDAIRSEGGFLDRLEDAFEQLVQANGGKLPRHLVPNPANVKTFTGDPNDVPTP